MNETKKVVVAFAADVSPASLNDCAIITANVEALGHDTFIDDKSVAGLAALLNGKVLKSYLSHAGFGADRLGTEIGVWQGFRMVGNKLTASLSFFKSFMSHQQETYERLLELASTVPDQLGVSIVAQMKQVWVRKDGTEMDAELARPADAVREIPCARFLDVESADLVSSPAANPSGLFEVGPHAGYMAFSSHLNALAAAQGGRVQLAALKTQLAETERERDALKEKNAELAMWDIRQTGNRTPIYVSPLEIEELMGGVSISRSVPANDNERWNRYEEIKRGRGEAAAEQYRATWGKSK